MLCLYLRTEFFAEKICLIKRLKKIKWNFHKILQEFVFLSKLTLGITHFGENYKVDRKISGRCVAQTPFINFGFSLQIYFLITLPWGLITNLSISRNKNSRQLGNGVVVAKNCFDIRKAISVMFNMFWFSLVWKKLQIWFLQKKSSYTFTF